eukprot:1095447-Lingulodinium_polyedra.AAC.1
MLRDDAVKTRVSPFQHDDVRPARARAAMRSNARFAIGVMRHACARRARAISWRAHGACVCAVFRRVGAAKRAFDHI